MIKSLDEHAQDIVDHVRNRDESATNMPMVEFLMLRKESLIKALRYEECRKTLEKTHSETDYSIDDVYVSGFTGVGFLFTADKEKLDPAMIVVDHNGNYKVLHVVVEFKAGLQPETKG